MSITKKILSLICSAALAVTAFTGCSGKSEKKDESSAAEKTAFTVSVDNVAADMGAGWNLGNTLEANSGGIPNETVWGNPEASQEIIDMVADAGFKTIRIPVSYLSKIDDANGYKIDEAWLDRIKEVVDYCYNRDLYVIINVHGDGYNSVQGGWLLVNGEDQDTIKAKYEAVWKQLAEKFKDYDEHLVFESMNEVFDGGYEDPNAERYANLVAYNQIFVDTVRAAGGNNTHRYLLVPGWNTNINYTCDDYGFELPADEKNTAGENRLMVSVHFYDPWDFCGQEDMKGYLWGEKGHSVVEINGASKRMIPDWGDEAHIEAQVQKLVDSFVSKDVPVIVGEYGCIDKTSALPEIQGELVINRAYFNAYVAGTCAANGIIPVYWDNGYNGVYGFGLFNRKTLEVTQPEIIDAIVKAVETKAPVAHTDIRVGGGAPEASADGSHAYIAVQTKVYTFRNAHDDATYGKDSEWFNTLIKWGEDSDGDGKDDIIDTGATFQDAVITGNGTYKVSVSGYDFSQDCDGLNMLYISTDLPFNTAMGIDDVVIYCDDTAYPVAKPVVMADAAGNLCIEVVNIYNTELAATEYVMPLNSLAIEFTLTGMAS